MESSNEMLNRYIKAIDKDCAYYDNTITITPKELINLLDEYGNQFKKVCPTDQCIEDWYLLGSKKPNDREKIILFEIQQAVKYFINTWQQ